MILENGVIRTMDPALPTAPALAIAGERIAGGVGTQETVQPSPERIDFEPGVLLNPSRSVRLLLP